MVQTRALLNLGWGLFNFGEGSAWTLAAYLQPTPDNMQRAVEGYVTGALNLITAFITEKDAGAGFAANGAIGAWYSLAHSMLEYLPKGASAKSISRVIQPIVNIMGMAATYPYGLRDEHKKLKTEYEKLNAQYQELVAKGNPPAETPGQNKE